MRDYIPQRKKGDKIMINAYISGMGYCLPPKILTNEDLEKMVDTTDEWIVEHCGIETRHILDDDKFGSDMGIEASRRALENACKNAADIDMIICATLTEDYQTPSTSCIIQAAIGAENAAAMDINAACTGFMYALSTAKAFITSGVYKNILIVAAEAMTKFVDWADRKSCVLFGDGAGAAVVSATTEDCGIIETDIGANGSGGMLLTIPHAKCTAEDLEKRITKSNPHLFWMNGSEVFKFAVRAMVSSTKRILEKTGKTLDDVSLIIPHQANSRIIDASAKRLKIGGDKMVNYIADTGNMSAACIPVALARACEEGRIKDGDEIVLVGFGGGLTWASAYIKWKA